MNPLFALSSSYALACSSYILQSCLQLPTCWSFFRSVYRDPFLCIRHSLRDWVHAGGIVDTKSVMVVTTIRAFVSLIEDNIQ